MNMALESGLLLVKQQRFDLAVPYLARALSIEQDCSVAHTIMAMCLTALHTPEKTRLVDAKFHALEGVRADPTRPLAHYALSMVLTELMEWDTGHFKFCSDQGRRVRNNEIAKSALEAAREAVRLDPANAVYHGHLAYQYLVREDWQLALSAANEGLSLDPKDRICLRWRSHALFGLEQAGDAEQTIRQMLSLYPESALIHAEWGFALLRRGARNEARLAFLEAMRINPTMHEAQTGLKLAT